MAMLNQNMRSRARASNRFASAAEERQTALRERSARSAMMRNAVQSERREILTPERIATRTGISKIQQALRIAGQKGMDIRGALEKLDGANKKFRGALDWTEEQHQTYLRQVREQVEMQEFEQNLHIRAAKMAEAEEVKAQRELHNRLLEILLVRGIGRVEAEQISKELAVVLRGLMHQEAIERSQLDEIVKDYGLILQIAQTVSTQMKSKEVLAALRIKKVSITDMVAETTQAILTQRGIIQGD